MRFQLIMCLLVISSSAFAQKVLNVRYPASSESIEVNNGVFIPTISAGYTLWLPKKGKAIGLVVLAEERRDSVEQTSLIKYAMKSNLAVIYVMTENPVELLFQEKKMKELADNILRVSTNFNIPAANILYAGHSTGGTRVLKLAIFCAQNKAYERITARAIAISDVPIDIHRYYQHNLNSVCNYSSADNKMFTFSMSEYVRRNLDGTPTNSKARYASYSPYSKYVRNGGNAGYLANTHVRGYIDSEINYGNEKLGGNAFDVANFLDQLELLGSQRAQIIVVDPKKKTKNSWDIVNDRELIAWFVSLSEN